MVWRFEVEVGAIITSRVSENYLFSSFTTLMRSTLMHLCARDSVCSGCWWTTRQRRRWCDASVFFFFSLFTSRSLLARAPCLLVGRTRNVHSHTQIVGEFVPETHTKTNTENNLISWNDGVRTCARGVAGTRDCRRFCCHHPVQPLRYGHGRCAREENR